MFFWNSLAFLMIQWMLAIWSPVSLPFLNPAWTSGSYQFMYCWSLAWGILSITVLISGEGNGNPLQYSCLENPMDRGAWWAAVHGVARSQTWLIDFIYTFHFHALEKEMATHSSFLAWRIPGTGEPGGLPSMGLHRVRHNWSDLAEAAAAAGTILRILYTWNHYFLTPSSLYTHRIYYY